MVYLYTDIHFIKVYIVVKDIEPPSLFNLLYIGISGYKSLRDRFLHHLSIIVLYYLFYITGWYILQLQKFKKSYIIMKNLLKDKAEVLEALLLISKPKTNLINK